MSTSSPRRQPLASHGQLRSPSAVGQLLKLIGIALAVVMVSGVGVVGYVLGGFANTISANAVEIDGGKELPPDISAYPGGFDLLLVGVDTCEQKYAHLFGERCEGKDARGTLNDVNLLVHVSAEPRRVTAVSFPRDLMLPIPECTDIDGRTRSAMSKQALNVAYEHGGDKGGLNCVAKTITELTGEDIEFAAKVTFGGVIEITDAIGGVDVCLASPIKDKYTNLDMAAGDHTIQGIEALQFLRTRKGVGDGSDLGRIGNQQQYMSSLARKMISGEVLGNVPVMLRLADTALNNLEASKELADPMKLVQIALAVKSVPFEDIVFVQYPTLEDPANRNKVIPDKQAATVLWDAITANKQLQITHQNTKYDGVVVKEPETPVPTDSATPPVAPDDVAELPSTIKGTSAAVQTCSNGNVRR